MTTESPEPTWNERMASEICSAATLSEGLVAGILEAAGELKCVRLKVLLGRCLEIIMENWDNHRLTPEIMEALK